MIVKMLERLEHRRFKVPKLEGDGKLMNKLNYDMTPDVQFEYMRNQARYAALYRRHVDLQKACEKKILAYERREKAITNEVRKHKNMVKERLSKLLTITSLNSHLHHDWKIRTPIRSEMRSRERMFSTPMREEKEKSMTEITVQSLDKNESEPRLVYLPAPRDFYYSGESHESREGIMSKYDKYRNREFMSALRRPQERKPTDSLLVKREITM